jgi:hypothetical protein
VKALLVAAPLAGTTIESSSETLAHAGLVRPARSGRPARKTAQERDEAAGMS